MVQAMLFQLSFCHFLSRASEPASTCFLSVCVCVCVCVCVRVRVRVRVRACMRGCMGLWMDVRTASSKDLVTWRKHGLAFKDYPDEWAKAGSVSVPLPHPPLPLSCHPHQACCCNPVTLSQTVDIPKP
jgi:hypothetical protein